MVGKVWKLVMMHFVFVYGSLKSGYMANDFLLCSGTELVGETRTRKNDWNIVNLGAFPAVVKDGSCKVQGEVYLVSSMTLKRLDSFESNGKMYQRELVELENGYTAWMYVYMHPVDRVCMFIVNIGGACYSKHDVKTTLVENVAVQTWE